MKKLALLLVLALLVTCAASALADVKRGDHGEEVRYLQWLLQKTGWLDEKPDGSFGPRTEQAVKDYQAYKGFDPSGYADAWLMDQIDQDRVRLDKEAYGEDYYEAYDGKFQPQATGIDAPDTCATVISPDLAYRETCETHKAALTEDAELRVAGDAESLSQAAKLWRSEIDLLFDAWLETASEDAQSAIQAARDALPACFDAQRSALNAAWDDVLRTGDQLALMLRGWTGTLCEARSGQVLRPLDVEPQKGEGTPSYPASCSRWSVYLGTEFYSCCAEHAGLFNREYAWTSAGAKDDEALTELITDWDESLDKLYDRWCAGLDEARTADVREAQNAFREALSLQDAAFETDSPRASKAAHLRAVQFECVRLCELLGK